MDIEIILLRNNFSKKTIKHVFDLFDVYEFKNVFGRSNVMKITNLKSSSSSKLITNLLQRKIIIPVVGHGKGKYKFNNILFYQHNEF